MLEPDVRNKSRGGCFGFVVLGSEHFFSFLILQKSVEHSENMSFIFGIKFLNIKDFIDYIFFLSNGWLKVNPFANYKRKMKRVDRVCLTKDELQIMADKEFDIVRLGQVRDVFLFCCFTEISGQLWCVISIY